MTVQAKVHCIAVSAPYWASPESAAQQRVARFTPVYDPDPASPNFAWSQATPSGYIELTITNPDAFGQFEVNEDYLLTFEPAPKPG